MFLVIANMIGAGVFTTSGFSLGDLKSPHVVVMAWVVGGMIAVAGAISYGMLIRAMPESGGEYLFLSRAAHPIFGFIAGWVSLIAGFSGAIAFAATAFESYLVPASVRPEWLPVGAVAVLAIFGAGALHGMRPRAGARSQNAIVLIKLGLLVVIMLIAVAKLPSGNWPGWQSLGEELTGWPLATAFAGSLVWISLSYSGFNAAVYIADEVEAAERIVPRALITGTLIVVVMYVLLNSVFVYAAPTEAIVGQADVAAIATRSLGGIWFERFVRGTIAICLLTSVLSMMMAAPRVYAKMADDGLMPAFLRFQGDNPIGATVAQIILASLLVLVSNLQGLLTYLGLTLSLSAAASVGCLVLPGVRNRSLWHPIYLIPLFYVAATIFAAALMTRHDPWQLLGTLLTVGVGSAVYVMVRLTGASKRDV